MSDGESHSLTMLNAIGAELLRASRMADWPDDFICEAGFPGAIDDG
jgi:hypothetical protein